MWLESLYCGCVCIQTVEFILQAVTVACEDIHSTLSDSSFTKVYIVRKVFSLFLSLSLALSRCYLGGQEIIETGCSILSAGSSRCEHPHLLVNVLEK